MSCIYLHVIYVYTHEYTHIYTNKTNLRAHGHIHASHVNTNKFNLPIVKYIDTYMPARHLCIYT
jgi:hypothetical protein